MCHRRAALAAAALSVLAACSQGDGRTLRAPSANQTTTVATAPTTVATEAPAGGVFSINGPFQEGGPIPLPHSCDGAGTSPALQWINVPAGTIQLAVVVIDATAGDFVHWVVTGLDPALTSLVEATVPADALQATNDAGTVGWTPPCPPPGEAHSYLFTVYSLATPPGVEPGVAGRQAVDLIVAASTASATLSGTYQRP